MQLLLELHEGSLLRGDYSVALASGMMVLGWRLDLMISEVFSNRNDSTIL